MMHQDWTKKNNLLIEVCSNAKNYAKEDDIDAEVSTGSQLKQKIIQDLEETRLVCSLLLPKLQLNIIIEKGIPSSS